MDVAQWPSLPAVSSKIHAHDSEVMAIVQHPFHTQIFASFSGWEFKIWTRNKSEPVISHVTDSTVKDIKWSPFYANILAVMVEDGRLMLFNFSLSKLKPVCTQLLVDHSELPPPYGCVSFCPTNASLICVCSNGQDLTTYKMPQNIRRMNNTPPAKKKAAKHNSQRQKSTRIQLRSIRLTLTGRRQRPRKCSA